MGSIVFYLMAGLGLGALYAMLGSGLVVVYRGSGVINFAHGAFAMYGVLTFDEARRNGLVHLPWVDLLPTHTLNLPVTFRLGDGGIGGWPAFAVAMAMSVLLGLAAHFLVFRPLRGASALAKVVASVGITLYLQGVAQLNFGGGSRQAIDIVPNRGLRNFLGLGRTLPESLLWLSGIALAIGLVLWAGFRFTRFGIATRAASSSEKGAVLLGYSTQRLAALNWVIATVLATGSAIVVGSNGGSLNPLGLSALVVPALGAALIGDLKSIPLATIGGLLLGTLQSLLSYVALQSWMPIPVQPVLGSVVPLTVIVVVLLIRGKALPQRGSLEERPLPLSPRPVRVVPHAVFWTAAVAVAAFLLQDSGSRTVFAFGLATSLVAAIIMLSLVVVTGYVGQISLVQMSLAGVAAFVMSRFLANGSTSASNPIPVAGPDWPWPVAALLGIACSIIVGVVVGLPAVRIRGVQLAVVTIAVAVALQPTFFDNGSVSGLGANALVHISKPTAFGLDLSPVGNRGVSDRPAFIIFAVIVLVLCAVAVANLRRNGTGRRFLAVRANERAAAASGINVMRTKLLAFAISSAIAGIGGVMLGIKQGDVSSANFISQASLTILTFAFVGGITSINGAIIGAFFAPAALFTVSTNYFLSGTNIERYVTVIGGGAVVLMSSANPNGIAPTAQRAIQRATASRRTRHTQRA